MVAAAVHRGVVVACVVALCGCEFPREPGSAYRSGADALTSDVLAADVSPVDTLATDVSVPPADVPAADVTSADIHAADVVPADATPADVPLRPVTQRSCAGAPASAGCGMVMIPRSTSFVMGAPRQCGGTPDADCARAGLPTRSITVDAFAIDAYEVSVARFRVFWTMDGGAPSVPTSIRYRGGDLAIEGTLNTDAELRAYDPSTTPTMLCNWHARREDHPMNCVNWTTAQAFCAWDTPGGRLPTQAEWEFAARGNSNLVCPWGPCDTASAIGTRACWSGAGVSQPNTCRVVDPARSGGDSPFGLHDMAGNVWEWNADWHSSTTTWWTSITSLNPLCGDSCAERSLYHVFRGGSWYFSVIADLRSASRNIRDGDVGRFLDVGFRCARDLP